MRLLKRLWTRLIYWWKNPFPEDPENIDPKRPTTYRPAIIDLRFLLYPDGKVYWKRRRDDGDRRIKNDEIEAMVHTEYRTMVQEAKMQARLQSFLEKMGLK